MFLRHINKLKKIVRRSELKRAINKQPYTFTYDDISVLVDKDVFPPDIGFASIALAQEIKKYKSTSALDMGSGTGFIALMMKKVKIKSVTAVDNHPQALSCIEKNLQRNKRYSDIKVVSSNLFSKLYSSKQFDLIVFNHPYSPAKNKVLFGNGPTGGAQIVKRFLKDAEPFLTKDGIILMSFASIFNQENDPLPIAKSLDYKTSVIYCRKERFSKNYVYEFKKIYNNTK